MLQQVRALLVLQEVGSCGRSPHSPEHMIRRSVIAVDSCRRLFRSSGLNEPSIRAIQKGLGFQEPLGLQSRAIQHILDGKSVILGDRTGQGKTLAYLMPVLDKMHAQNSVSTCKNKM